MAKLFVISGPSGAGLREIVGAVLDSRQDIGSVVPVTARKKKAGERDGVGFWFYDLDAWKAMRESGELLETTEFAGNDYGTSRRLVQEALAAGRHVLLHLDVDRAAQIKAHMPEAVCVYVAPSEAVLRERYEALARSPFELKIRLQEAQKQREASAFCDAFVCSDDPAQALAELEEVLER